MLVFSCAVFFIVIIITPLLPVLLSFDEVFCFFLRLALLHVLAAEPSEEKKGQIVLTNENGQTLRVCTF